ncbi:S-layer homology domain-containing protein [Paenibacillus sp. HB172176]|uniref:glycosyl hydrolase family 18 protein n=1 Tax=Paenibacillus sp. HB172176 TaxID=2493690 RepID=UPI001439EDC9|nr:S-layer homology domain-containing protein [Paenibacillus sp. HB172176]
MLKKILSIAMPASIAVTLSLSAPVDAYQAQLAAFKDVELNDYATESIYSLSALGIIDGYPGGVFHPDGSLTREAVVKLLVSTAKLETASASGGSMADVSTDRWSAPYIAAAYEHHWIDFLIDRNDRFLPEQTITREEMAALIGNYLLEKEPAAVREEWLSTGWKLEAGKTVFQDGAQIDQKLLPYLYYCVKLGIMQGEPSGFSPAEPLIRKQAAAVFYRLINLETTAQKLAFTGYYAISSYSAVSHMEDLTNVAFGWSHMDYDENGAASLDLATTEYKLPQGYEEPLAAAEDAGIGKELMIYYSDENLKAFVNDLDARQAFIDSVLVTAEDPEFGFTGINLDFEGLRGEESKAGFLAFVQDLKEQLGDLTLTVTVPPADYYKGYDLAGIGKAADEVILMAYDYTHGDSRLPSAPLPLVNEAVVHALAFVPKEKLVLGISKQANQWVTIDGETTLYKPKIADVESRLKQPGVSQTVELPSFLNKITYQNGQEAHEILYEDTKSIAKKLWLANYYGLKGVSLWHMGNLTAEDWSLIEQEQASSPA